MRTVTILRNSRKQLVYIVLLVILTFLAMGSISSSSQAQAEHLRYDPRVHYYRDGMNIGHMNDNVRVGTFGPNSTSALGFEMGIQPMAVEAGSWFYPKGDKRVDRWPSRIRQNSCGGGDDSWADYFYINENELWSNDIVVTSNNAVSGLHITVNGGLNGGYYCVGGSCTISVCTTQALGSDARTVWISWN